VDGLLYTTQTDTFISQDPLFYYGAGASISAGRTGNRFIVKGTLFD